MERIEVAERAYKALEEVMEIKEPTLIERDASIQRFEFTFEVMWKAAKQMLFEIEGIDVGSPKGVIRSCREIGLFDDREAAEALQMVDDRNLTAHTYNETLAREIHERLQHHVALLQLWLQNIKRKVSEHENRLKS